MFLLPHPFLVLISLIGFAFVVDWIYEKYCFRQVDIASVSHAIIYGIALIAFVGFAWLWAIHDAQFKPHVITRSINGHVIGTFTATNPEYVSWQASAVLTTNGVEYHTVPTTNYYWHVWSCFRR
jgi:hypothetical protein